MNPALFGLEIKRLDRFPVEVKLEVKSVSKSR